MLKQVQVTPIPKAMTNSKITITAIQNSRMGGGGDDAIVLVLYTVHLNMILPTESSFQSHSSRAGAVSHHHLVLLCLVHTRAIYICIYVLYLYLLTLVLLCVHGMDLSSSTSLDIFSLTRAKPGR